MAFRDLRAAALHDIPVFPSRNQAVYFRRSGGGDRHVRHPFLLRMGGIVVDDDGRRAGGRLGPSDRHGLGQVEPVGRTGCGAELLHIRIGVVGRIVRMRLDIVKIGGHGVILKAESRLLPDREFVGSRPDAVDLVRLGACRDQGLARAPDGKCAGAFVHRGDRGVTGGVAHRRQGAG